LINLNQAIIEDGGRKTVYQYTALADIELEKYMFMKVSEVLNQLGPDQSRNVIGVAQVLLQNIIISNLESGIEGSELNILARALDAQRQEFDAGS
jgi:hypothetical protein